MNANELRQMIRRSDKQPFVVHMDDGASYKVTHPDFALPPPERSSSRHLRAKTWEAAILSSVFFRTSPGLRS
jgi:hypothetical protein